MPLYPETFEKKTGFDIVRRDVEALCVSQPGRDAAHEMLTFSCDAATVKTRLQIVAEMLAIIESGNPLPLTAVADMRAILGIARAQGTMLSPEHLLDLNTALTCAEGVSAYFRASRNEEGVTPYPLLNEMAAELLTFPAVSAAISRTIDRFGEVKDTASPKLGSIRRQIASTTASLSSIMRRVISRGVASGVLDADTTAVVRDGRMVVPVAPMNKRKISGIVHDESASGKTFFIEPAEMVEANNRVRELQIEEKREIARILRELTDTIRPHIDDIIATTDVIGRFDFVNAKALYARRVDGRLPSLSDAPELEWYHAEHPVLQQSLLAHGRKIVPLDITLGGQRRVLIISGPNAGGKSVCLKTVGIVQYMMQCGLLPTVYENSHMGIFSNIFIDIGDDQSIEDDLSTYSSHLRNMKHFVGHGDSRTLVLIDEFGAGTEPQIGGAIAQAILKRLNDLGVWGVITTHYQNLKTFAEETDGLVNGSMLYDRHLMQPLFKLSIGNPGSSFAIEIAKKTGLPESIIDDAREIAGSDYVKLDRYLLDIARDKRYWENKRDNIRKKEKQLDQIIDQYGSDAESLRAKRREIIEEARTEARRIIDESNASVERTIREIRNAQAERERTRAARERLASERRELDESQSSPSGKTDTKEPEALRKAPKRKQKAATPKKPEERPKIAVGSNVRLDDGNTVGTVLSISGEQATVSFGMLKTTVATARLRPTIASPTKPVASPSAGRTQMNAAERERQLNFSQQIDVRGMRVDEALQAITYYIDDAIRFSAARVRILHGTGTGALRQAIRQYLTGVPGVATFHDEHVQFGGAGITVVDLK